ncbi:M13 family metallopeptidase [Christensenella massiliensis]|uniref:M13 family metallopeptidase n=1 Tax=Christensenella massiliensis TaxID=1805714 RepID=A0AAU8ABH4_9FIRM
MGPPSFSLSDADEYKSITDVGQRKKDAEEVMFKKLLARAGYSEEEAAGLWEAFFALETEIAQASIGNAEGASADIRDKAYNPKSAAELAELSPDFPLMEILKPYTDGGVDRFILTEPEWLAKMNELYTEENVEGFKAWLIYQTLTGTAGMLDQECLDIMTEYSGAAVGNAQMELPTEQLAYEMCSALFDMAIGKLYVESYVTEETKRDVTELVNDAVAVYRQRLEENEWLGDETKERALEKLDTLKVRVAYPDDWSLYDYSDYALPEDGGIIDDILAVREKAQSKKVDRAKAEIDKDLWMTAPQTVNAFYQPTDNSINIPAGILGGDFYDPNGTVEQQMGSLGIIIGHEITHGFDSNMGSLYDKDGNLSNWWTEEDRAAFKERTDKVGAYYAGIEVLPGKYVNGEYTIGETVADLGGMSCMLELAKGIDGFDYQTFFESWAKVWKLQESEETAEYMLQIDTHAPGYLRANVNVQQFQEFYDAFGVEEGDGMYLAPEERLSVW